MPRNDPPEPYRLCLKAGAEFMYARMLQNHNLRSKLSFLSFWKKDKHHVREIKRKYRTLGPLY